MTYSNEEVKSLLRDSIYASSSVSANTDDFEHIHRNSGGFNSSELSEQVRRRREEQAREFAKKKKFLGLF